MTRFGICIMMNLMMRRKCSDSLQIVDFKEEYPDIYIEAITKMEEFQKSIINNAL